ncbi:MAG: hypothetical protein IPL46_15665 [Saprospiraceae bacterium]|nr:hypothetical protein [Saprospiraceae bacterium]
MIDNKHYPQLSENDLAELLHLIRQCYPICTSTLRSKFSKVEPWLENFLRYHHVLEAEDRRYAAIYLNPQSIVDGSTWQNFYNRADDLIQLARDTQVGISESTINLKTAAQTANQQYTSAGILAVCLHELGQWSGCIQGTINQNEFISNYR